MYYIDYSLHNEAYTGDVPDRRRISQSWSHFQQQEYKCF